MPNFAPQIGTGRQKSQRRLATTGPGDTNGLIEFMITQNEHLYSLAAATYVLSCVFFAVVRWFHTCTHSGSRDYFYPGRLAACIFYLNSLFLLPYVFCPGDDDAWLLAKYFYPLVDFYACGVLLLSYFGSIKHWLRWRRVAFALAFPIVSLLVTLFVLALSPGTQHTGSLGTALLIAVIAVSLVCLAMCVISMATVSRWIRQASEDEYSNADDFPVAFARVTMWIPSLHFSLVLAVWLTDSPSVLAAVQLLLAAFNVAFLIEVLPTHRQRPFINGDVHDDNVPHETHEGAQHETEEHAKQASAKTTGKGHASPMSGEKKRVILEQINKIVVAEQLFLKPHLTVSDVAERCSYGRTYVSQVFKEELGGFYAYINRLRLDYAADYLNRHPMATKETVALEAGFTSRQALYNARKHLEKKGMQPH